MINVKRFPGVCYRYKSQCGGLVTLGFMIVYLMFRWGFICTNHEINQEIENLCNLFATGNAVGNLCKPLCIDKRIHSVSCISQNSKKRLIFTAKWNQKLILIKSAGTTTKRLKYFKVRNIDHFKSLDKKIKYDSKKKTTENQNFASSSENEENSPNEKDLEEIIRSLVTEKLNLTLTNSQLDDLRYLEIKNKMLHEESSKSRKVEISNVLDLLQSREYLFSRIFSDRDIFPEILGTCGNIYAVEYLESPSFNSIFTLDDKAEWSERMKLAVAVMEFVEETETNFPDALHLCDVQMRHIGLTSSGRVKFLNLDYVYMKNVIDNTLRTGKTCKDHRDCDLLDCKSMCDVNKKICDAGVANDNLQSICEKIFIGWTMSGKVIVPGLLMSEYTPASLSALLRLCAENRRKPVPEDLRQRLYITLTEMHQILLQKMMAN